MSKKDKTNPDLPHFDGKDRSTFKPFATVANDVLLKQKMQSDASESEKSTQMTQKDSHNPSAIAESAIGQRELESRLRLIGVLLNVSAEPSVSATGVYGLRASFLEWSFYKSVRLPSWLRWQSAAA